MNTEPVVLTSTVSGLAGGVTRFCGTASEFTVLKNGCTRMERVTMRSFAMSWTLIQELQ